jgi:hypothetical protein
VTVAARRTADFDRFAGYCAFAAAALGIVYGVVFFSAVAADSDRAEAVSEVFLLLGGLVTIPVFVALYERLRAVEPGFALLGLLLGVGGALGTAVHGAFDLGLYIDDPNTELRVPNPIDPRGFLAFGVAGLALLVLGWLISRAEGFHARLAPLAYATGVLLVLLYLARLTIGPADNPIVVILAVLAGFIASPLLYVMFGRALLGSRRDVGAGHSRPGRPA